MALVMLPIGMVDDGRGVVSDAAAAATAADAVEV